MNIPDHVMINERERLRAIPDEDHHTTGSYALDTEEETKAAEDHERRMIQDGAWDALVLLHERQCETCGAWEVLDAVGGYVGPYSEWEDDARQHFGLTITG